MSDVFISYSRLDRAFVGQLRDALIAQTQDVWIDWESIPPSQTWWSEIQKGIARANNFVVVLSPNSMASPICQMEIEYARQLGKRIIPVLHDDYSRENAIKSIAVRLAAPDQDTLRELWGNRQPHSLFDGNESLLKHLNYFFFRAENDFASRFNALFDVIRTDYAHKEQHTTLELRASEWSRRNQNVSFLLLEDELALALAWLAQSEGKAPSPTQLQREYIRESEKRTQQLRNIRRASIIGSAVAAIAIVLVLVASLIVVQANNNASSAEAREIAANQQVENINATLQPVPMTLEAFNRQIATQQTEAAQLARNNQRSQAEYLADLSDREYHNGNTRLAVLLADEALSRHPDGYFYQGHRALVNAGNMPGLERLRLTHEGPVDCAEYLPDGRILTCSEDSTVRLWDGTTGESLAVFHHDDSVVGASLYDSNHILSWSTDWTLRLWDITTGEETLRMQHDYYVHDAQILPDKRIVSRAGDGMIRVWDGMSETPIHVFPHYASLQGMQIFSDSRLLSWAHDSTYVWVWDLDTGELLFQFEHGGEIEQATVLPNGNILTWADDNTVHLWDGENGAELKIEDSLEGRIQAVDTGYTGFIVVTLDDARILIFDDALKLVQQINTFVAVFDARMLDDGNILFQSSNHIYVWDTENQEVKYQYGIENDTGDVTLSQNILISFSYDEVVHLYDFSSGRELFRVPHIIEGLENIYYLRGAEILPDHRIMTWLYDGTVRLYDLEPDSEIIQRFRLAETVTGALVLPSGRAITWNEEDPYAQVWDALTRETLFTLNHDAPVHAVITDGEGQLMSWANDATVRLWDEATGAPKSVFYHPFGVAGAKFTANHQVISWTDANTVHLWNALTGEEVRQIQTDGAVYDASLSPTGELLVVIGSDVHGYSADGTEKFVLHYEETEYGIQGVKFFEDGRIISWDLNTVRLWDGETGQALSEIPYAEIVDDQHFFYVKTVEILSDTRILTTAYDDSVRIWDVTDGSQLMSFQHDASEEGILGVNILPNGTIRTWGNDGSIHLWDMTTGEEIYSLQQFFTLGDYAPPLQVVSLADGRLLMRNYGNQFALWVVEADALLARLRSYHLQPLTERERTDYFLSPDI